MNYQITTLCIHWKISKWLVIILKPNWTVLIKTSLYVHFITAIKMMHTAFIDMDNVLLLSKLILIWFLKIKVIKKAKVAILNYREFKLLALSKMIRISLYLMIIIVLGMTVYTIAMGNTLLHSNHRKLHFIKWNTVKMLETKIIKMSTGNCIIN